MNFSLSTILSEIERQERNISAKADHLIDESYQMMDLPPKAGDIYLSVKKRLRILFKVIPFFFTGSCAAHRLSRNFVRFIFLDLSSINV